MSWITEEVRIPRNGKWMYGICTRDVLEKRPCVLMLHGFTGDCHEFDHVFDTLANRLAQQQIASIRIDFLGSGQSDGLFSEMSVLTELADAQAALDYVQQCDWVDTSHIFVLGMSMGGLVVSLLCEGNEQLIRALCLWAPAFNLPECRRTGILLGHHFDIDDLPDAMILDQVAVGRIFLEDLANVNTANAVRDYRNPVMILHGRQDSIVPVSKSQTSLSWFHNAELKIIEDADHCMHGRKQQMLLDMTCQFLEMQVH